MSGSPTRLAAIAGFVLLGVLLAFSFGVASAAGQGTTGPQGSAPGTTSQPGASPGATGSPGSLYPHLPKPIRQGHGRGARRGNRTRPGRGGPAPLSARPPTTRGPSESSAAPEEPLTPSATRALPATGEELWLVALTGFGLLLSGLGLALRTGGVPGRSPRLPW
ncbi:MAG TPA: hypothetical protein VGY97_00875 [Solirubrobacteraceae bacterium]|nr:hypothetical protein [Solirubrobacteraceae bacterium]